MKNDKFFGLLNNRWLLIFSSIGLFYYHLEKIINFDPRGAKAGNRRLATPKFDKNETILSPNVYTMIFKQRFPNTNKTIK